MMSLSGDNEAEIIDAFNSTSRYLDDLLVLNIGDFYFDGIVNQIYQSELQLNKENLSATETPSLDLHLTISDASSKIYGKCDDFDFDIVNFPFLEISLVLYLTGFMHISAHSVC